MAENQGVAVESPKDFGTDKSAKVSRWLAELELYRKDYKKWEERGTKIIKRYRDERPEAAQGRKFNALWSNVETLRPALYGNTPVPDVRRRHLDRDPVGRTAAEVLERTVSTCIEMSDLDGVMTECVTDYALVARGTAWVRYIPTFKEKRIDLFETDQGFVDIDGHSYGEAEQDDFGFYATENEIASEETRVDYTHRDDFAHSPARTWAEVRWVAKRAFMTRDALIERFGRIGEDVPLDKKPEHLQGDKIEAHAEAFKKAEVWEFWDKPSKTACWIAPSYKEGPLDQMDDPLGLENFFPCPKPLYGSLTNDSLVPVPDYAQYQDQAEELDDLTERIAVITKALKVGGWYAGGEKDTIGRFLMEGQENALIPVEDWAMFMDKGGARGLIAWYPIETVVQALVRLYEAREQVKQDLYEISGIADILRGQVDPREKLGQSEIKGRFATLRLGDKQKDVARFARDIVRIMAEIIAEHFSPETLAQMSGMPQMPPKPEQMDQQTIMAYTQKAMQRRMEFNGALQLLANDKARGFKINIETDSTVAMDETVEKQRRTEFLTAVTPFLQVSSAIGQQAPEMVPLLGEMLLFTARGFKAGRTLESAIEEFVDQLRDAPRQQQRPDPAMIEAQQKAKLDAAKVQGDQRLKQAELQGDMALKKAELEGDFMIDSEKARNDMAIAAYRAREAGNA